MTFKDYSNTKYLLNEWNSSAKAWKISGNFGYDHHHPLSQSHKWLAPNITDEWMVHAFQ